MIQKKVEKIITKNGVLYITNYNCTQSEAKKDFETLPKKQQKEQQRRAEMYVTLEDGEQYWD